MGHGRVNAADAVDEAGGAKIAVGNGQVYVSESDKIVNSISVSPLPANPVSTISYVITESSNVKLTIYSVSGQKVATLVDGFMPAGKHAAVFDGANLASGVYFYRFAADGFAKTGKMVLVK